jgi:BON domain
MGNWIAKIVRMSASVRRWLAVRRRLALLLIPFGLATGRASAGDEPVLWTPVFATQNDRTRYDLALTLRARRLLIEDPALARYEISVRIEDRVAELTGPVPSMDVALRAENDLRGLLGLASIRNQLTIRASAGAAGTSEQARVDWRFPQLDGSASLSFVRTEFTSRLAELPAEPALSWRPAHGAAQGPIMPVPFLPEGLTRPAEPREQARESDAFSRDNLRIGRVDVVKYPAEIRSTSEALLLPPTAVGNADDARTKPLNEAASPNWQRIFFIGF